MHTWEDCVAFHGHACPGLAIGYRAALEAAKLLEMTFSDDEQLVCVTENDACCVDAIQVMLGCSVGKGNLIFRLRGKMAFSFYERKQGKSVRLLLKPLPEDMDRQQRQDYLLQGERDQLFTVKEATFTLPEKARLFPSYICEQCGESTAEPYIHLEGGKKLCSDCYTPYTRSY